MAHYIRRNLPQKCLAETLLIGYLVRNAKLIHEQEGSSQSKQAELFGAESGGRPCG